MFLDAHEYKMLLDFVKRTRFHPNNKMEINLGCSHYLGMQYEYMVRDFYFQCGAGTKIASVMANGDIGACLDIERREELSQGNVYTDDFVYVWENKFKGFRRDRTVNSSVCGKCKDRKICMGDSAHTWDYDLDEPRYCVANMIMGVQE